MNSPRNQLAYKVLCALACLFMIPNARAQHDVHATLIKSTQRKPALTFQLENADGQKLRLADFRGKVVLLNFWATECGGCVLEIPSFIEIQKALAQSGFTAIGVSADIPYEQLKTSQDAWKRVRPFILSHHINYPIVVGSEALIDSYGFESYPATYLIDKHGRIAAEYEGVVNKVDVQGNVEKLIAER